jgi:hypothetical protein
LFDVLCPFPLGPLTPNVRRKHAIDRVVPLKAKRSCGFLRLILRWGNVVPTPSKHTKGDRRMRTFSIVAVGCLALGLLPLLDLAKGQDPLPVSPKADNPSLEKRVADLERQLPGLKKELQEVRGELQSRSKTALVPPKAALSPAEAIKQGAKQVVTVEFGVGSATFLLDKQYPYGSGPVPPIVLEWENVLTGGGRLFVLLNGQAVSKHVQGAKNNAGADEVPPYPSVRNLEEFCKQIMGRGIRATGRIQAIGPDWSMNYQLIMDDPDNFTIIK